MSKYLFPKLSEIFFLSLLFAVLILGPQTFNLDGDLGRHITIGDSILDTHSIPKQDIFSHTMFGEPLTPHEWLAQIIFALAHRVLGLSGPVLVTGLIIAATFTLTLLESVKRSSALFLSLGLTFLAASSASIHWLSRPHVFTFLYLAIWVLLLERVRNNRRIPVWVFGAIMLLWANTHGAFISGFVVWGAYLAGDILESWWQKTWSLERLRTWMIIGILAFAVTFINPAGIHLWETTFGFLGSSYLVSHTQEYLPPYFHDSSTWPFLFMLAVMILLLSLHNKKLPLSHALLLTGWSAMGLYSARNIPLYAIVATPILSTVAANISTEFKRWSKIERNFLQLDQQAKGGLWLVAGIVLSVGLLFTPGMQAFHSYDAAVFPVDAENWLDENHQAGNIFNEFKWGGYLLYQDWPDSLVFIDGQTDFYGESLTREYEQVIGVHDGWEDTLAKYEVSWSLIPSDSLLAETLHEHRDWQSIYEDETAVIFVLSTDP